jgi:predicted kinase
MEWYMAGNSTSLKVSEDLYEVARRTAKIVNRSVGSQIEYWANLGRVMEQGASGAEIQASLTRLHQSKLNVGDVATLLVQGSQNGDLAASFRESVARDAQVSTASEVVIDSTAVATRWSCRVPVVVLLVGPNGSGKSTLYEFIAKTHRDLPFVNADNYEREHLGHVQNPSERSRVAREWAEGERRRLITEGISFIAETVFSHASKVDLIRTAKTQRFEVELHIIACDDVEILVRRVARHTVSIRFRQAKSGSVTPE